MNYSYAGIEYNLKVVVCFGRDAPLVGNGGNTGQKRAAMERAKQILKREFLALRDYLDASVGTIADKSREAVPACRPLGKIAEHHELNPAPHNGM